MWSIRICAAAKSLQSCPTLSDPWTAASRLLRPWDFPGKSTGVGAIAFSEEYVPLLFKGMSVMV